MELRSPSLWLMALASAQAQPQFPLRIRKYFAFKNPRSRYHISLKIVLPNLVHPAHPITASTKRLAKKNYGERGGKFSNDNLFNRSWRMHIHNSQQNQNFFDHFQTYSAIYYDHSELSHEEK